MASSREAAGAVCWAIYVVLHLPPTLAPAAARTAVVRSLLERTVPKWAGDAKAHAFLTDTLGLPCAWLDAAQVRGARGDVTPCWVRGVLGMRQQEVPGLRGRGAVPA